MDCKPLVSIILPTYNRAELLNRAIKSVLNQTYKNWELIIWNDGSSDNTAKVVKKFNDERIIYFYDDHHGKSYALNNSIRNAKGKFIAFIDDDDQWIPEKLDYQMDIFNRNEGVSVVFGNFRNYDLISNLVEVGFVKTRRGLDLLETRESHNNVQIIEDGMPGALFYSNFIAFDTAVLLGDIFLCYENNYFNENLRNSEDFEFWVKISLQENKFAFSNKIVLDRFKTECSLSRPSVSTYLNRIKALDSCKRIATIHKRNDLIKLMDKSYCNAWQNLIYVYGERGELNKAIKAFIKSNKFGFSFGSFHYLFLALIRSIKNKK